MRGSEEMSAEIGEAARGRSHLLRGDRQPLAHDRAEDCAFEKGVAAEAVVAVHTARHLRWWEVRGDVGRCGEMRGEMGRRW